MPRFHHLGYEFSIPDEWWSAAGVSQFEPVTPAYRVGEREKRYSRFIEPVVPIPLVTLQPIDRNLSHGVFRDRESVVQILRGFVADDALPPVCVTRAGTDGYALFDGAHRFYCAIAVGFSLIPAIDVSEGVSY